MEPAKQTLVYYDWFGINGMEKLLQKEFPKMKIRDVFIKLFPEVHNDSYETLSIDYMLEEGEDEYDPDVWTVINYFLNNGFTEHCSISFRISW